MQDENMQLTFENLFQVLKEGEFEVTFMEGPKDLPMKEIHMALGNDLLGKPLVLQIGLMEGLSQEGSKEAKDFEVQFIHFLVMLPIEVKPNHFSKIYKAISELNSIIELPGFGLLEEIKIPFYRYTLLCNHSQIDEKLFLMVIGLILNILDNYASFINNLNEKS